MIQTLSYILLFLLSIAVFIHQNDTFFRYVKDFTISYETQNQKIQSVLLSNPLSLRRLFQMDHYLNSNHFDNADDEDYFDDYYDDNEENLETDNGFNVLESKSFPEPFINPNKIEPLLDYSQLEKNITSRRLRTEDSVVAQYMDVDQYVMLILVTIFILASLVCIMVYIKYKNPDMEDPIFEKGSLAYKDDCKEPIVSLVSIHEAILNDIILKV